MSAPAQVGMLQTAESWTADNLAADLRARASRVPDPGGHLTTLWNALADAAHGGSGVRPALLLATYGALGGTHDRVARELADATELLHTAFLVHDDVIDHDEVRRGRPTVVAEHTARAHGRGASRAAAADAGLAAGILAGDLALVRAVSAVALLDADHATRVALVELLEDIVAESAAGELSDTTALPSGTPDLATALTTAERKTAAYTFVWPMRAAALLVGTPDALALAPALERVGRLVGVAFQLRDDLRGTFGDPETTGKSCLSDLREGRITSLVAVAAGTGAWSAVASVLGDPDLDDDRVAPVREALSAHGVDGAVARLAADRIASAVHVGRAAGVPEHLLAMLCAGAGS
ncbi:polyprenyl synthetase family protein [Sanguibacter sp. A247]|uniref:polyprenyl synthetase family protein n=1 Tax=unclassified Sanguibacter TaxID=2645534 RepID=UPI003FD709BF